MEDMYVTQLKFCPRVKKKYKADWTGMKTEES